MYPESSILGSKKVIDLLIINLHVRNTNEEFPIVRLHGDSRDLQVNFQLRSQILRTLLAIIEKSEQRQQQQ